MRNIFVPSGDIFFHGDYKSLMQTISQVHGTMTGSQEFSCSLADSYTRRTWNPTANQLLYIFRCRYDSYGDGFRITYKVLPGSNTVVSLIIALFFILGSLCCIPLLDWGSVLVGVAIGIFLGLICLHPRQKHIRYFQRLFSGKP